MKNDQHVEIITCTGVHPDIRCANCHVSSSHICYHGAYYDDLAKPEGVAPNHTKSFFASWNRNKKSSYEGDAYYCSQCHYELKLTDLVACRSNPVHMNEVFTKKFMKECYDITRCHPNVVCKECGQPAKFIMYDKKGNAVPFFFHPDGKGVYCEFCRRKKENEKLEELKKAIESYQDFVNRKRE